VCRPPVSPRLFGFKCVLGLHACAYEVGGGVSVTDGATVWTGFVDETGVSFGGFVVFWVGESLEARFEWDIGSMDEGDFREVYLTVSTDTDSVGQQEFTSPGTYFFGFWGDC
jgi:hypothetical protein